MTWLTVAAGLRRRGVTISQQDSLIAATALHHGLTVATGDTAPFAAFGCGIVNPWEA